MEVKLENRKQQIDNTRALLSAELKRITEILDSDTELDIGHSYKSYKVKAELKGKMLEARRDMIRLEKLMYDYRFGGEDE